MPIMTNSEAFRYDFGMSAIDLWQMKHEDFIKWLNEKCDRERPIDMIVRCKDCIWWEELEDVEGMMFCTYAIGAEVVRRSFDYCSRGERKDDEHSD